MRFSVSYMAVVAALASLDVVVALPTSVLTNLIAKTPAYQQYCWKYLNAGPSTTVSDPRTSTSTTFSTKFKSETTVETNKYTTTTTSSAVTTVATVTVTAKAKRDEVPTQELEARALKAPAAFTPFNAAQISAACNSVRKDLLKTFTTGKPHSTTTSVTKPATTTFSTTTSVPAKNKAITERTTSTFTPTVTASATPITSQRFALGLLSGSSTSVQNIALDDTTDLLVQSSGDHVYFKFVTSAPNASPATGTFQTDDSKCLAYEQYYQALGVTSCSNATETTFSLIPSTGQIYQDASNKGITVASDKTLQFGGSAILTWADVNDN